MTKQARGGDKQAQAEERWVTEVVAALQAGRPARTVPVPDDAPDALRNLQPLTAKPVLFVANVDEGDDDVPPAVADHAAAVGALAVAVSSRLEAELSELDDEDASRHARRPGRRRVRPAPRRRRRLRAAAPDRLLHRRRGQAGAVLAPARAG